MSFLLALLVQTASAAEVTDMPDALQGSLALTYAGYAEFGALEEAGVNIGQRRVLRNDLDWQLEFSPYLGLAFTLGLSQTPALKYSYPNAREMLFDPVDGSGTYLLSDQAVPDVTKGSGLNGIWIGTAFSPWSESYSRGHRATWRLDLAFRTGSKSKNLWIAKDGKRGTAPGGTAFLARGSISQDHGVGNPWATVEVLKENAFTTDLVDESGTTWAKEVTLQPASQFEIRSGVEVVGFDDGIDTRWAVDFWLGFGYRSWENVTSGVNLPNVLDSGRRIPMTAGDQTYVLAGITADYHINDYVRARTGPDFRFHTPFVPEHTYNDVLTAPKHIGVGWMFTIQGMARADGDAPKAIEEGVEILD